MKVFFKSILLLSIILSSLACSSTKKLVVDQNGNPVPEITWDKSTLDLGEVLQGETRDLEYNFTNTGSADLVIELITSCKCNTLDWPRKPVPPGGRGTIKVTYDSTNQKLGLITKTIDVIANTDPIVVEAFFNVVVIYQNKG